MTKTKSLNEIFNITYGRSRSLLELVNIIKSNIPKVKIKYVKRDKLIPYRGTLSVNKAKKLLKWKPKIHIYQLIKEMMNTDLEQIRKSKLK